MPPKHPFPLNPGSREGLRNRLALLEKLQQERHATGVARAAAERHRYNILITDHRGRERQLTISEFSMHQGAQLEHSALLYLIGTVRQGVLGIASIHFNIGGDRIEEVEVKQMSPVHMKVLPRESE